MAMPAVQMKWGSHYLVGVAEVDQQHEHIAQLINELCDSLVNPGPKGTQARAFDELVASVAEHFETEERMMRKTACPDYDLHKAEHEFLTAQVLNFQEQFMEGSSHIDESLLTYLRDWFRNHIMVADRRMGRHLRTCGNR